MLLFPVLVVAAGLSALVLLAVPTLVASCPCANPRKKYDQLQTSQITKLVLAGVYFLLELYYFTISGLLLD